MAVSSPETYAILDDSMDNVEMDRSFSDNDESDAEAIYDRVVSDNEDDSNNGAYNGGISPGLTASWYFGPRGSVICPDCYWNLDLPIDIEGARVHHTTLDDYWRQHCELCGTDQQNQVEREE